jgi:hypothetical protein
MLGLFDFVEEVWNSGEGIGIFDSSFIEFSVVWTGSK